MAAVADDFWNIYTEEWQEARQSLRSEKHDEEIIYLLMQIVRCLAEVYALAMKKIANSLPLSNGPSTPGVYDFCLDETKDLRHKKNKEKKATEELTETYLHHKLPPSFHRDHVTNPVRLFVHRCIECLYQMCLLKHSPISIHWIPKGEVIDKQKFDIERGKDEHVCDWTVWPAVIHTDGTVLKKGVVIPV